MKIRNILGVTALAMAGLAFAACGGKDGDSKGGGGALSIDDRVAALEAEIAALKEALKSAAEDEIPALQAALADAQAKLDALNTCANGGPCEGTSSFSEVSALTDAYCEWAFNCCSDNEVRATLSAAAGDVDGCKDMYADMLFRGDVTPYMPGAPYWEGEDQAEIAAAIQGGRIEVNSKAVAACAELMAGQDCGGETSATRAACGDADPGNACDEIFVGLQDVGETCTNSWSGEFSECKPGLLCNAYFTGEGVCVEGAADGDPCQKDIDCQDEDGSLYCDEGVGECKVKPTVGETCVFEDPQFNNLTPNNLSVPCQGDSWCSMETSKCVAGCDTLNKGDLCHDNYSNHCGDDMWCDMANDPDGLTNAGVCENKFTFGLTPTGGIASRCLSGSTYNDGGVKCDGFGGDDCSTLGSTMCNSGACNFDDKCLAKCDDNYGDSDCASGEHCVNDVCYPNVATNQDCFVDEQCPAGQWCDGSCTAKGNVGDSCSPSDYSCKDGLACDVMLGECVAVEGQGNDAECYDWYQCKSQRCDTGNNKCLVAPTKKVGDACTIAAADRYDINKDPCGTGQYCKLDNPNASPYDDSGTCTAQGAPGDVCNQVLSDRPVCQGNVPCVYSQATQKPTCPNVYTAPDADESCTLNTFSVYTAYGLLGGGDYMDQP